MVKDTLKRFPEKNKDSNLDTYTYGCVLSLLLGYPKMII